MIDVNKILQLEYLNGFISELNKVTLQERKNIVEQYSLDTIITMKIDEIKVLFEKYGVKSENICELIEDTFLDESWEFAYLYSDDISYSLEQKQKLRTRALKEVDELNKKINIENEKIKKKIKSLQDNFELINVLVKVLNDDGLILDEDIELLRNLISVTPLLEDEDRFRASLIITKHLIESDRKILVKKEVVDTSEFEQMLDEAYGSSTYSQEEDVLEDDLRKLPYYDLVMKYYERYKDIFLETGYSDIFELMSDSDDLYSGDEEIDSISREYFGVEIASLLYRLNYKDGESDIVDAMMKLEKLDKLFQVDSKYKKYKEDLLKEMNKYSLMLVSLSDDSLVEIEIKKIFGNRIKLLSVELKNNIIGEVRKEEVDLEYRNIKNFMDNLSENLKTIVMIEDYFLKISTLYSSYGMMNDDISNRLSFLQDSLLNLKKEVYQVGIDKDISLKLNDCFVQVENIEVELKNLGEIELPKEKVTLKGFVLFDFDENNQPYVVDDLNPSSDNKMIDSAIQSKDLKKGFDSYSKLIRDLFMLGNTEKLANSDSHGYNTDKLNEAVYNATSNRSSKNTTGMYRLRGDRNGVERFVEQKLILHSGTILYDQIVSIIKETIPNVEFDLSDDVVIYINFVSSMKKTDFDTYNEAIKRYKRKSPLYMLLIDDKNKERLSDKECELFREILKMTINAFYELERLNPNLEFDIIKQMGGVKTHE